MNMITRYHDMADSNLSKLCINVMQIASKKMLLSLCQLSTLENNHFYGGHFQSIIALDSFLFSITGGVRVCPYPLKIDTTLWKIQSSISEKLN